MYKNEENCETRMTTLIRSEAQKPERISSYLCSIMMGMLKKVSALALK